MPRYLSIEERERERETDRARERGDCSQAKGKLGRGEGFTSSSLNGRVILLLALSTLHEVIMGTKNTCLQRFKRNCYALL